ncbi:putative ribonuclease H-like domain-containing protein [Tanacetum coccineum]
MHGTVVLLLKTKAVPAAANEEYLGSLRHDAVQLSLPLQSASASLVTHVRLCVSAPPRSSKYISIIQFIRDLGSPDPTLYSPALCKAQLLIITRKECKLYGDDPIACLNKAMAFLSAVAASRFPSTNNQLRTSSNMRNQATIQDGKVTVQQVQGRQGQSYVGTVNKGYATSSGGNNARGHVRVIKCYNCQGKGHMARQCTQPKRPRNAAWFKDKAMLAEAQESGQILDEEKLTEDLDAYDSDCHDVSNAKAVLMANLSNYGSDVISDVPHFESYHNDMDNQSVPLIQDFKQTFVVDFPDNKITSDSNIIPYSQYLQETQQIVVQDTNLYAQQDSMILSMIE